MDNLGKLYERIINARIKKGIKMTGNQAEGWKGTATVDNILILKELIIYAKNAEQDS